MHESLWYFARNEVRQGPVSFEHLQGLARSEQLAPGDLVWTEGMASWAEARTVENLFEAPPVPVNLPLPVPGAPGQSSVGTWPEAPGIPPAEVGGAGKTIQISISARSAALVLSLGLLLYWLFVGPWVVPPSAVGAMNVIWNVGAFMLSTLLVASFLFFRNHRDRLISQSIIESVTLAYRRAREMADKIGAVLAMDVRVDEGPFELQMRERKVLVSLGLGFVASFIFGGILYYQSLIFSIPDPPSFTLSHLRRWVWLWILCSLFAYIPVEYWLQGKSTIVGWFMAILGEKRALRRHIALSLGLTPLIHLLLSPVYLVGWTVTQLPHQQSTLATLLVLTISFGVSFYLMSFTTHWQATSNHAHKVLSCMQDKVLDVREAICSQMAERHLPDFDQKEVVISEQGVYPMLVSVDVVQTDQIQITHRSARVILRVLAYGDDLYFRWESFFDMSGRRLWLLVRLVLMILSRFIRRWIGISLYDTMIHVKNILLPWEKKDTTGQQLRKVVPFSNFAEGVILPSHVVDNIYALEDMITESAERILNEAVLEKGRKEKVRIVIDRSRGAGEQLF